MTETKELNMPDIGRHGHSMFKPCCMTVFIHDYAFPPSDRAEIFPFIYMEGKPKRPIPLQIYSNWTLDLIRGCSDEQIGKIVRQALNNLEEEKRKIETKP